MMSPQQRRRIAQRAIKRDLNHPRTHSGRLLHVGAAHATAQGSACFDGEHVERDPETGRVTALVQVDMFDGPADPDAPQPQYGWPPPIVRFTDKTWPSLQPTRQGKIRF